ncbi:MAG: thiamine pyrophosphate-binding protein [Minwuia sp.]|uniref:thiamine pyrophosphate-binding protein n=1 Tax=Minwuia sp. TaxID=2493630 RepID=UPI003A841C36
MTDWPDAIFGELKRADIRQVAYVPDAGHSRLITQCRADPDMRAIPLTNEMEGPAVLAGAWLGGQRGVLLMQSSGVGNCPNMIATSVTCRFPLLMLVTMRGEFGEFNPWQLPMGQNAAAMLEQLGTLTYRLDRAEDAASTVAAAAGIAFEGLSPVAVLIAQKLIGTKTFAK